MAIKIVAGIEIDTSKAQASIDALNKKLEELNENVEDNAEDIKKVEDALEDLGETGKKTTKDMSDGFSELPGPLGKVGSAFKSLKAGVKALKLGFVGLKGAIAATGIGLLVIAVAALAGWFTANEENANKLKQAMAALGAVMGNITEAIDNLSKGNFAAALKNVTTEMVTETKAAFELSGALNEVAIAERGIAESRAETNKLVEQAKLDAKDLTKSNEERAAALQKVIDLENEQTDKELVNQRKKVKALVDQAALSGTLAEDAEAISEAKIRLDDLEAASIRKKAELVAQLNTFETTIEKEKEDVRKAALDKKKAADKEEEKEAKEAAKRALEIEKQTSDAKIALIEDELEKSEAASNLAFDRKIAKLDKDNKQEKELILLLEQQKTDAIAEIRKAAADKKKVEEQALRDEERAIKQQIEDIETAAIKNEVEREIEASNLAFERKIERLNAENEIEKELILLLEQEKEDAVLDIVEKAEKDKKALRLDTITESLTAAQSFTNQLKGLSDSIFAAQLANAKGNEKKENEIRKKAFTANKAFAIANAVMSTGLGIIKAFTGDGPMVVKIISAAIVAATGVAQIAKIASTKFVPTSSSGGSGGASSVANGTIAAAANPNPEFTGSGNNLNTVGGGAGEETPPIEVTSIVTISETEITSTQETVDQFERAATLGG